MFFYLRLSGKTHIHHFYILLNKYNAVSLTILKATINIPLRLSLPISYRAISNSGTDLKSMYILGFCPQFFPGLYRLIQRMSATTHLLWNQIFVGTISTLNSGTFPDERYFYFIMKLQTTNLSFHKISFYCSGCFINCFVKINL